VQAFKGPTFPGRGKISAVYAAKSCEAELQLPTAPTKQSCTDLAPVVWLTVGLLAVHGIAIQVRGVWHQSRIKTWKRGGGGGTGNALNVGWIPPVI